MKVDDQTLKRFTDTIRLIDTLKEESIRNGVLTEYGIIFYEVQMSCCEFNELRHNLDEFTITHEYNVFGTAEFIEILLEECRITIIKK